MDNKIDNRKLVREIRSLIAESKRTALRGREILSEMNKTFATVKDLKTKVRKKKQDHLKRDSDTDQAPKV